MKNLELCELTAEEMVMRIRRRKVSRRELMQAHLDRITAVNGKVNAIVELRAEAALAEADAADRDHARRGHLPLDGVPVSIKDHRDVQGMRRTEGARAMAENRSPQDDESVRRLRAAGAIIIGKANQPDFQCRWNTISGLHGPTRNPRNLELTVGGSSGGDAAAVAAGMAAIGLGGDYGGSIRVPAAFCGVYGLRPSAGRIPQVSILPPFDAPPTHDLMASIGPLARGVDDLRVVLEALAGPDPRDPGSVPAPLELNRAAGKLRVVRMCGETGARVEPEIEARLDETAGYLAQAGYEIVHGGIPEAHRAPEVWVELVGADLMNVALPVIGPLMDESCRQHIEMLCGLFDLGGDLKRYLAAFIERRKIARLTAQWMEENPLVLTPIAGMPAPPLDFDHFLDREQTMDLFDHMRNVPWVNLLSLPSVALPNGIQIVARRFHEAEALAAAATVERVLGPIPISPGP